MLSKLAEFKKLIWGGGAMLGMVLAGVLTYGTGVIPASWLIPIQGVLLILGALGIYTPDGPVATRLKALGKPVPTRAAVRAHTAKSGAKTPHTSE